MSMGYTRANQVISCQIATCSNVFSSVEAIKTYFPIRTLGILACYSLRFLTSFLQVSSNYPPEKFWHIPQCTQRSFCLWWNPVTLPWLTAYLLVTYSNKTSASLEVIKRCITQNMLLQSWRRSSWPCGMFYSLSCIKMKGRAAALFRLTLQKVQW